MFAQLPREAAAALASQAVERRYSAGEVLFTAGTKPSGLLIILDGKVRVVRGRDGRQHLVHDEEPGGALGEVPVFGGGSYPATAIAGEVTRCLLLRTDAILSAAATHPAVALAFLRRLGDRTRLLVDRMDRLAAQPVTGRLARLLLSRQQAAREADFVLGKSQLQVAEELGTVREVVVRALRQLRRSGIIVATGRGRYRVRDEEALRAMAE